MKTMIGFKLNKNPREEKIAVSKLHMKVYIRNVVLHNA